MNELNKYISKDHKVCRYPCTDTGNMERYIDHHQGYLCSLGSSKNWITWDGIRWKPVGYSEAFNFALNTCSLIKNEAANASTIEDAQLLNSWAKTSQGEHKIKSMLNMAANNNAMLASINDFDKEPSELNCLNGIINLKTGELRERSSEDKNTKLVNVSYSKDSQCPHFEKFVEEVFNHDEDLIKWVQRAIGYSLTGSVQEQVLFICYGTGANGKSTLLETIARILGDYSTNTDFEVFLSNQKSDVRIMEAVGELKGIRIALASEVDASRRFNESLIKRLTGGDTLRGTKLHSGSFLFAPQHKLWFLTNHLPFAKDGSHGFWRRIRVIPFNQRFEKSSLDSSLPEKLWAEREGILRWIIEGAVRWYRELNRTEGTTGLGFCKAVDESLNQYRYDNDYCSRFIDECLRKGKPEDKIGARDLFHAYQNWNFNNDNDDSIPENIFSRRMEERGLKKTRANQGIVYLGVVMDEQYSTPTF